MDLNRSDPPLWRPSAADSARANLTRFMGWLAAERGLAFADYGALWRWSVSDLAAFWEAIWDFCGVVAAAKGTSVLAAAEMPGAVWFPGARLNWAENVLARMGDDRPVLLYKAEDAPLQAIDRARLAADVGALAEVLRRRGIGPGDRVVAYLPNIPEAVVAVLAVASVGAIWSSCPPGLWQPQRARPLRANRAPAADRHRRLSVWRQGFRPPRRGR